MVGAAAHELEHCLDRSRVRFPEVSLKERREAPFQFARFCPVVAQRCMNHLSGYFGHLIGGDTDEPVRAHSNGCKREVVVAGKNLEPARKNVGELGKLSELAAS